MDEAKQQLADKLKSANNILVTVSRDPSVDQLSALLGLTLLLNKQGKHSAAVFSGQVPSTLEFLQPEATIEKNTDSLRDFIIALDKAKADKLRYKVEDNVVKIFITPYKTSITEDDFEFSQGDFNVDVVVAIGVYQQEDLDDAITAHGRILHDATVASINLTLDGGLGTINWHDPSASSLSELVAELGQAIGQDMLDQQIATALLTGIVAETDRFRNEKTSARTMSASAALMAAGANQQLVAEKLEAPAEEPTADNASESGNEGGDDQQSHDGILDIAHDDSEADKTDIDLPAPQSSSDDDDYTDTTGLPELPDLPELQSSRETDAAEDAPAGGVSGGSRLVTEPPSMGGTLTANSSTPKLDPVTDPLSMPANDDAKLLDRKPGPLDNASADAPSVDETPAAADTPASNLMPPPADWKPPTPPAPAPEPETPSTPASSEPTGQTLSDLEASVEAQAPPEPPADLDSARDEVNRALNGAVDPSAPSTEPVQALNAQPLGDNLHSDEQGKASDAAPDASAASTEALAAAMPEAVPSLEDQIPGISTTLSDAVAPGAAPNDASHGAAPDPAASTPTDAPAQPQVTDPNAPPPVPPPIPFQFGNPPKQQ